MNKILCSKCKCKTCAHTYYFGGDMPDDYCDNCDFCDLDNGYGDYGKLECVKYKRNEIMKGIQDIKSGNVMDFDKAMNEISNKYGL